MAIDPVYVGENVPLTISYVDGSDVAADADAAPTITITAPDDTESVSAATIDGTVGGTGDYEYVWDTTGEATGEYTVEITAEFSSETKINRDTIRLR